MRRAYGEIYFILASLLTGLVVSGAAQAQMAGTPHDLGGGICEYCHTPAISTEPESPLWNLKASAKATFTLYESPTIIPATEGQPRSISLVCLACHDGVTSHNTLLRNSEFTAARDVIGSSTVPDQYGSSDPHPISVVYNRSRSIDFKPVEARKVGNLPLYRSPVSQADFNSIECASCHNPHDASNGRYLRMDNASSALCLTCHDK